MSSLKRNLFLSVFGAAMSATVAFAADLPAPPVIEYEPETTVEIGTGWYLRGDLGIAAYTVGDVSWQDPVNGKRSFYDTSLANGWLIGAGIGYYFDEHFRADLTVDYRQDMKFKGKITCIGVCGDPYSSERTNLTAVTVMLNGYYDFGTWHSVTPYLGAGVGAAYLETYKYRTTDGQNFSGDGRTNFAWNVMAGAAVDVTDEIKLDANYRFLSLGEARTASHYHNGSSSTNPVRYEDLYAHEFRVGLRYDLN
jgi:opacity protein-like surface antigen